MDIMEKNICPFCGEGHLIRRNKDVEYTYKGAKLLIASREVERVDKKLMPSPSPLM